MPESSHYAFVNCISLDRHLLATEYEEILQFCQQVGFYYAVKAEDTNVTFECFQDAPGKVHCHFLTVCEMATFAHTTGDKRYGAKKKSHYRETFCSLCPAISAALSKSEHARKFSFMSSQMTSDHAVVYFSKETLLKASHLPDDLVVLRPYISLKTERRYNPEDDAHQEAYRQAGFPLPATFESVWAYLNMRWYKNNDCKRVKMEAHRINIADNLVAALNEEALPVPKCRRISDSTSTSAKPKSPRVCPRCPSGPPFRPEGPNVLESREQFCWQCKD